MKLSLALILVLWSTPGFGSGSGRSERMAFAGLIEQIALARQAARQEEFRCSARYLSKQSDGSYLTSSILRNGVRRHFAVNEAGSTPDSRSWTQFELIHSQRFQQNPSMATSMLNQALEQQRRRLANLCLEKKDKGQVEVLSLKEQDEALTYALNSVLSPSTELAGASSDLGSSE